MQKVRRRGGARRPEEWPNSQMDPRKLLKFKGDGIELACADYGGEGNPPMLLLHGGAAHARWWDFVAPELIARFHVLALDQRGHGESPWTDGWAYGSRHYAADLAEVIRGWEFGKPVLIGHSMGGHTAMVYAAEHGDTLRALVTIDSIPAYPEPAITELASIAGRPAPAYDSLEDAVASFRLLPAETMASPDVLRHIATLSFRRRAADGKWVHKMDRRTLRREPIQLDGELAQIRCPALVVKPALSPVLSVSFARGMAERMAHGRMVLLERSNHHAPIDNPTGVAAAILPFLDQASRGFIG